MSNLTATQKKNLSFTCVDDMKRYNSDKGYYYFSPNTMKAFGSRIHSRVLHGRWTIVKNNKMPTNMARFAAVYINSDGSVSNPSFHTKTGAEYFIDLIEKTGIALDKEGSIMLKTNDCISKIYENEGNEGYHVTPNKWKSISKEKIDFIKANPQRITYKNNRFYIKSK